MTDDSRIAELEARSKSNTHRIDKLEKQQDTLQSLATSVAVMANEQKTIARDVSDVKDKVETLEAVPGKRWSRLVEQIIAVLAAAALGFLFAKIGV